MMFPLVSFERIENHEANDRLVRWGHYLRGCNRPYGKQSFGLFFRGELLSVAVSATLVKNSCFGFKRKETCELARLCTHPNYRQLTRVCLRLWRECAALEWSEYWPVLQLASYSRRDQHTGSIYRFDGWTHFCVTRASRVGAGTHHSTAGREIPSKDFWIYPLSQPKGENHGPSNSYTSAAQPNREATNLSL